MINKRDYLSLAALVQQRIDMERDCTDPEEWEKLAKIFDEVGYIVNASRCRKRAEHYKQTGDNHDRR